MIQLIQIPWSPFCIVQRRILEYSRRPFKIVNVSSVDRSLVWRLTRQRYYEVPILKDGRTVVFETDADSQVIAKYIDDKFRLGLFPKAWDGLQAILWRYIEHEIEAVCFKLNDIYYQEFVPAREHLAFVRHKERKFGRHCIEQWREQQKELLKELERRLVYFEQMLDERPFLLDDQPRFVDFNLYGMLGNLLYTGHYELPKRLNNLRSWRQTLSVVQHS